MDKSQVIKTIHELIPTLLTAFQVHKVILYGSWTEGYPDHESDIDIAVVVHETQDYLQGLIRLYELCSAFDVRIEPILFEYGHDPSGFLEHMLSQGEVVYEEKLLTCSEQRGRAERVDAATQNRNEG